MRDRHIPGAAGSDRTRRRASTGARRNPEAEAAILAAAREVMDERGYAGLSFDEVARRAGAGKPTIYRRWPTKADLLIAVYAAEKAASIPMPATGNLTTDLIAYTRDLWRFWRETPCGRTFRALIAEAQTSDAALEALRTKFLPDRTQQLRQVFERAAARGEIDAPDLEAALELYLGFNWLHLLINRIEDDPTVIARMARIIASGAGAYAQSKHDPDEAT